MRKLLTISIFWIISLTSYGQNQNWFGDSLLSRSAFYQSNFNSNSFQLHSGNYYQALYNLKMKDIVLNPYQVWGLLQRPERAEWLDSLPSAAITQVHYYNAYVDRQALQLRHQQNLKGYQVLADYYSNKSQGFLNAQILNHIGFNLRVKSPLNQKVQFDTDLSIYSLKQQTNGGIQGDSVLEEEVNQYNLLNTFLTGATESSNHKSAMAKVKYGFNPSFNNDSVPKRTGFKSFIGIQGNYRSNHRVYQDNFFTGFYSETFLDSSQTYDSLAYSQSSIGAFVEHSSKIVGILALGLDFGQISFYGNGPSAIWLSPSLYLEHRKNWKKIQSDLSFRRYQSGTNSGDYKFHLDVNRAFAGGGLHLSIHSEQFMFAPFYQAVLTNHHFWNLSLEDQKKESLSLSYENSLVKLALDFSQVLGFAYFQDGKIQQDLEGINMASLELSSKFQYRFIHWEPQLTLQAADKDVITQPSLIARNYFTASFKLFKTKIPMQVGLHHTYLSGFGNNRFNPALGTFEYDPEAAVYPNKQLLDAFYAIRIKTVRVYVRVENVLDGLSKQTLLYAPGQIIPPRNFRLGIIWRVFD